MLNFIPRIIHEYNCISNIKENCTVSIITDSLSILTDSAIVCQIRKHYTTTHPGNTHNTAIDFGKQQSHLRVLFSSTPSALSFWEPQLPPVD